MAAKTPATVKLETEGDLQVVTFTLTSVTDGDTCDISNYFKNIVEISITSSTKTAFGETDSAGVITFKCETASTAGAATLKVRAGGN